MMRREEEDPKVTKSGIKVCICFLSFRTKVDKFFLGQADHYLSFQNSKSTPTNSGTLLHPTISGMHHTSRLSVAFLLSTNLSLLSTRRPRLRLPMLMLRRSHAALTTEQCASTCRATSSTYKKKPAPSAYKSSKHASQQAAISRPLCKRPRLYPKLPAAQNHPASSTPPA